MNRNRDTSLPQTLPEELIEEILLRLPVKSILHFKCVCKSWFSLISNPRFVKSHFDVAAAPTHRLLTFGKGHEVNSIDIDAALDDDSGKVVFNTPIPSRTLKYGGRICIVGSCRGLIFLKSNINFVIWNPSTGFHKRIHYNELMYPQLCGFGYDSSTDDYVVVVVTLPHERTAMVDCFSTRTNSWSASEGTIPYYYCDHHEFRYGEFLNGALHWLVRSYDHLHVIIAFDARERTLSEIPVPRDLATAFEYEIYPLKVIGGCLCFCFMNYRTTMLEMWMMKEYKVHSSWTKSFLLPIRHDSFVSIFYPLCFTKNGEILGTDGGKVLAKFNHKGQLLEHSTHDCKDRFVLEPCRMYRESLLSLPEEDFFHFHVVIQGRSPLQHILQLCGQKSNTLKPTRSLFIREEEVRLGDRERINTMSKSRNLLDRLDIDLEKIHLPVFAAQQNLCLMKNRSINSEIHARTLWEKIESLYVSKCGNNKLFLLNYIVSLKFKERTSLLDHLNEFQGIIDQMSGMGIKFEDEILGLLLLNSLPDSWETFKVSITNSTPNGVVSLQMVKGSVLNKEMRRKAQGGEVRKRKEKRVEVNPSLDTRMWSVTTVTKQGIYRSIVSCGKRRTKAKRASQKRRMMIVSLLLQ
ncbi:F-box protein CPR30, partial [Mucuna pruriens]